MLKTVIETLDGVDDAVKPFYAEDNGKFILKIDGIDNHPDVVNLKSAYERTKVDRDSIRSKLTDAEKRAAPEGFDPEAWKAFKEGKPDAQTQQQLVQLRQTLEAERDEWKGKYTGAVEEFRMAKVKGELSAAIRSVGVTDPTFEMAASALLAPKVKIDGDKAIIDTDMGPMPIGEYVKRWASTEGKSFVAPAKGDGAGGSSHGTAGGKTISSKDLEAMTPQAKAEFFSKNPGIKVTD